MVRKRGLGRGLDALLGGTPDIPVRQGTGPDATGGAGDGSLRSVPVERIRRGRHQPRRIVDESALEELAHSVRSRGIVQPIVVRPAGSGGFEIVAGERRWRAAQMAGLDEVPVVVRECSDSEAAAVALIENIQREDLNPIEEAEGYRTLADEFGFTHQELADTVGALPLLGVQHAAPAGAQRRRPGPGRAGRARHGARAGPAPALRSRAEPGRGGGGAGVASRPARPSGWCVRMAEGRHGRLRNVRPAIPTW